MFGFLARLFGGKRRRERRRKGRIHPLDVLVEIDHHRYAVEDMTANYFRIIPYGGSLIEGQRFNFRFILNDGDEPAEFPESGVVLRIDAHGLVAHYHPDQPLYVRRIERFLEAHARQEQAAA